MNTPQLNILKRDLAAQQLITHVSEMEKTFPSLAGVVVGGDFNTNPDQPDFASEKTLGLFGEAGFVNSFGELPLAKRVTHPGKGRYPDATFDYLFTRGVRVVGVPEITATVLSDHWPVTVEVEVH